LRYFLNNLFFFGFNISFAISDLLRKI